MLILVSLLFVAWAYAHDSAAIREIYSNPCGFVHKNIPQCKLLEQLNKSTVLTPNLDIIEALNSSDSVWYGEKE